MRPNLSSILVLALLASCTPGGRQSHDEVTQGATNSSDGVGPVLTTGRTTTSLASIPDRGALLAYPSAPGVAVNGFNPVAISEAHAMNAIKTGELVLNTPDHGALKISYSRHEEYPDGNWSWFGHDREGREAIVTFGADAAFGSFPQRDGSLLKITTMQGRSYLVKVPPERIAHVEAPVGATAGDQLIPPRTQVASSSDRPTLAGQAQAQASIVPAAVNEVDLLLGYSTGLATRIGSESGAITRMQNLVAIANQAYQNSGITMRLRLVRSMQVSYADNADNQLMLERLTGSTGSGSAPVDPAFAALRAAREEVGADLVSFVHQYRDPENDGCGIAWLLGGGQVPIDQSDAAFAYSVVADGSDVRESDGRTYFCRDETLAHELGHNMGQAHNAENSSSPGAHAYSYGYREASTSGFFTVMSYRLANSSQVGIPHFANPGVTYAGRPTGIANQSDNARSMNQTMPLIANFRAAIVPGATRFRFGPDINADGVSDFIWHRSDFQYVATWQMSANAIARHAGQTSGSAYRYLTTGDYDGDKRSDIVWRGQRGDLQLWFSNGSGFDYRPFLDSTRPPGDPAVSYPNGWTLVASSDMDGNGTSDLIWYNQSISQIAYWLMSGNTIVRHGGQAPGRDYRVVSSGDYNADGRTDLVWRGVGGDLQFWFSNGTDFDWKPFLDATWLAGQPNVYYPTGWSLIASADMDGNGMDDLVWFSESQQRVAYWIMSENSIVRHGGQSLGAGYSVLATGDYNADHRVDLVWRGSQNDLQFWFSNGNGFDYQPFLDSTGLAGNPYVYYPQYWSLIGR